MFRNCATSHMISRVGFVMANRGIEYCEQKRTKFSIGFSRFIFPLFKWESMLLQVGFFLNVFGFSFAFANEKKTKDTS